VTGRMAPRILLLVPEVERGQIEPDRTSKVELDIQDGEPIRGQLSASGTGALPFYGWLELVAAIQAARRLHMAAEADVPLPSG
jgi:hypothetical protein